MKIVKTAGKKFRLYSDEGNVLGTVDTMREAKRRMIERDAYKKAEKNVKKVYGKKTT